MPKLKKFALVRRKDKPNEENLIVGDHGQDRGSVRVYGWSKEKSGYVFIAEYSEAGLTKVGEYLQNPPALLERSS